MQIIGRSKIISIVDMTALFFFCVMVFFLPISNAVIESSFGFILLCFIIKVILSKSRIVNLQCFFSNRINFIVLVFYFCIGFSIIFSPMLGKSLRAWFCKWGENLSLFFLAQVFLKKKDVKIILWILIASTFLIAIDGIYQKVSGTDFLSQSRMIQTDSFKSPAVQASFGHFNDFASFLVVVFFINGYFLYTVKKKWLKAALLMLVFLIIANMLFTYSRGAWLSFLTVCLSGIWLIKNKKFKLIGMSFLIIFIMGIFFTPAIRERFLSTFTGSGSGRTSLWEISFLMFKKFPVSGIGLGLFMEKFGEYAHNLNYFPIGGQYAHNCYLQILAETGMVGLIPFLWFLWEITAHSYRKIKKSKDFLLIGLYLGFLAFLIHSFFDTQLFSLKLSILFWLLASFIMIYLNDKEVNYG